LGFVAEGGFLQNDFRRHELVLVPVAIPPRPCDGLLFRVGRVDPTTARPRLVRMTGGQRTGWLVALGAHELRSSLQLERGRLQRGLPGQELRQ
jgi:hypothetical protein